jgi:hypothetical protein
VSVHAPIAADVSLLTVPPDEHPARVEERCAVHPQRPSVARCGSCNRTLCIACAVPVRSTVYGSECLPQVLGEGVPTPPPASLRPRPSGRVMASTVAFVLAAFGTTIPWTRFQEGSGPFGAWGLSPRWSLLTVAGCVAGLVTSVLAWRGGTGAVLPALRVSAVLVVLGSILAIARPPAFAPPWLGPWVSLAAGIVAVGLTFGAVRAVRRERDRVRA